MKILLQNMDEIKKITVNLLKFSGTTNRQIEITDFWKEEYEPINIINENYLTFISNTT